MAIRGRSQGFRVGGLRLRGSSIVAQAAQVIKGITKAILGIERATPAAIRYALEPIYDKSQVYVPVKTGDLKSSGYLIVTESFFRIHGEVGYAESSDPFYAVIVHERLDLNHAHPTRAKYLEHAVDEEYDNIEPRIRDFLKGAAGV